MPRANPLVRTVRHDFGPEDHKTSTERPAPPDGYLWLAARHIEHRRYPPRTHPSDRPDLGACARYSAAAGTSTEFTPLSAPAAINLDACRGNLPRFHPTPATPASSARRNSPTANGATGNASVRPPPRRAEPHAASRANKLAVGRNWRCP